MAYRFYTGQHYINTPEWNACIKCPSNVQAALSSELQFAQPKSKSALLKYIFKSLQIKIKTKQCQKDELHSGLIKAIITSCYETFSSVIITLICGFHYFSMQISVTLLQDKQASSFLVNAP